MGNKWKQWQTLFSWAAKSLWIGDCSHEIKTLAPWKKSYDKPRQHVKKQRYHFAHKGPYSENYGFSSIHVRMRQLDHKEGWAMKSWCWSCAGEYSWESLGLQGYQTSPFWRKSFLNIHWKGWCWSWSSITLATWCEELTHWKRPWCWERFKVGGEGDDRGWDGWMTSPIQWTWVWVNSGSWWWTGRPGMLQSTGLQRVGHDWAAELNWYV